MILNHAELAQSFEADLRRLASLGLETSNLSGALADLAMQRLSGAETSTLRETASELRLRAEQSTRVALSLAAIAAGLDFAAEVSDCSSPTPAEHPVRAARAKKGRRERS